MEKLISIWIIFSSRKGGHAYPSKALFECIKRSAQGLFCPQIINLLDLSPSLSFIDAVGRLGDLKLRWLYRKCYSNLQRENPIFLGSYRFFGGSLFKGSRLHKKLLFRYGRPDIIVSLQPEVNNIAHLLKNIFSVPIHTVIIDLCLHGLWLNRSIDHYYVPNEHLKKELMKCEVNAGMISVTGIPLREGFMEMAKSDIRQVRKRLKIRSDLPTILLIGGLLGTMVDFDSAIVSLQNMIRPFQLLVIFGKNDDARMRAELLKRKSKWPMHFFGTVSNVAEMIWASDIIVSKPGSVTISEVLSLGKPMVVITPKAGSAQEMRFAHFLKSNGAGEWLDRTDELGKTIERILNSKNRYDKMRRGAWQLGSHNQTATAAILDNLKKSLVEPRSAK